MLTEKILKGIVQDAYDSFATPRNITICTGINGYWQFEFNMKFGNSISNLIRVENLGTKRVNLTGVLYLSLFKKHGLYKVRVEKNKVFKLLKGTQVIITTNSISLLNDQIDELNNR